MDFLTLCRNQWERTVAIVTVLGGLIAFLLGWIGLSNKSLVTEQVPYVVSGALFGLFLLAIGTTAWLSADLHDEWVKLDQLEELVARSLSSGGALSASAARDSEVSAADVRPARHPASAPAKAAPVAARASRPAEATQPRRAAARSPKGVSG